MSLFYYVGSEFRYIYKTNERFSRCNCRAFMESRFVLTWFMLFSKLQLAICSVIIYTS